MQVSAEVRWFRDGGASPEATAWFKPAGRTVGGSDRRDDYMLNTSPELGVKKRGSKPGVELKTMIERRTMSRKGRALDIELWVKTSWDTFDTSALPTVVTEKQRQLRKFVYRDGAVGEVEMNSHTEETADGSKPPIGCNVELTTIRVGSKTWTSIGAESFGGPADSVDLLSEVLVLTLAALRIDSQSWLASWKCESYPSWLGGFVTKPDSP